MADQKGIDLIKQLSTLLLALTGLPEWHADLIQIELFNNKCHSIHGGAT
jgi:hypothetical protein